MAARDYFAASKERWNDLDRRCEEVTGLPPLPIGNLLTNTSTSPTSPFAIMRPRLITSAALGPTASEGDRDKAMKALTNLKRGAEISVANDAVKRRAIKLLGIGVLEQGTHCVECISGIMRHPLLVQSAVNEAKTDKAERAERNTPKASEHTPPAAYIYEYKGDPLCHTHYRQHMLACAICHEPLLADQLYVTLATNTPSPYAALLSQNGRGSNNTNPSYASTWTSLTTAPNGMASPHKSSIINSLAAPSPHARSASVSVTERPLAAVRMSRTESIGGGGGGFGVVDELGYDDDDDTSLMELIANEPQRLVHARCFNCETCGMPFHLSLPAPASIASPTNQSSGTNGHGPSLSSPSRVPTLAAGNLFTGVYEFDGVAYCHHDFMALVTATEAQAAAEEEALKEAKRASAIASTDAASSPSTGAGRLSPINDTTSNGTASSSSVPQASISPIAASAVAAAAGASSASSQQIKSGIPHSGSRSQISSPVIGSIKPSRSSINIPALGLTEDGKEVIMTLLPQATSSTTTTEASTTTRTRTKKSMSNAGLMPVSMGSRSSSQTAPQPSGANGGNGIGGKPSSRPGSRSTSRRPSLASPPSSSSNANNNYRPRASSDRTTSRSSRPPSRRPSLAQMNESSMGSPRGSGSSGTRARSSSVGHGPKRSSLNRESPRLTPSSSSGTLSRPSSGQHLHRLVPGGGDSPTLSPGAPSSSGASMMTTVNSAILASPVPLPSASPSLASPTSSLSSVASPGSITYSAVISPHPTPNPGLSAAALAGLFTTSFSNPTSPALSALPTPTSTSLSAAPTSISSLLFAGNNRAATTGRSNGSPPQKHGLLLPSFGLSPPYSMDNNNNDDMNGSPQHHLTPPHHSQSLPHAAATNMNTTHHSHPPHGGSYPQHLSSLPSSPPLTIRSRSLSDQSSNAGSVILETSDDSDDTEDERTLSPLANNDPTSIPTAAMARRLASPRSAPSYDANRGARGNAAAPANSMINGTLSPRHATRQVRTGSGGSRRGIDHHDESRIKRRHDDYDEKSNINNNHSHRGDGAGDGGNGRRDRWRRLTDQLDEYETLDDIENDDDLLAEMSLVPSKLRSPNRALRYLNGPPPSPHIAPVNSPQPVTGPSLPPLSPFQFRTSTQLPLPPFVPSPLSPSSPPGAGRSPVPILSPVTTNHGGGSGHDTRSTRSSSMSSNKESSTSGSRSITQPGSPTLRAPSLPNRPPPSLALSQQQQHSSRPPSSMSTTRSNASGGAMEEGDDWSSSDDGTTPGTATPASLHNGGIVPSRSSTGQRGGGGKNRTSALDHALLQRHIDAHFRGATTTTASTATSTTSSRHGDDGDDDDSDTDGGLDIDSPPSTVPTTLRSIIPSSTNDPFLSSAPITPITPLTPTTPSTTTTTGPVSGWQQSASAAERARAVRALAAFRPHPPRTVY
jgi:hypothetical protein